MNYLGQLWRNFLHLPQAIAQAWSRRVERDAREEAEVERLDRIRNPSKYRGK
jgi:hypothetical protein